MLAAHGHESAPVTELSQGLPLTQHQNVVTTRELIGYTGENGSTSPVWGKRLGLWHPLTGTSVLMNETGWQVYDFFSETATSLQTAFSTGIPTEVVDRTVDTLISNFFLLPPSGETLEFKPILNKAEMYMETTQACNYRCMGCATKSDIIDPKDAKTLTPKLAQLFIESFVRSVSEKGVSEVNLKWAGGEPTLGKAFEIVEAMQAVTDSLQKQYPEVTIEQTLLTNGVPLTQKKIEFIKRHNIYVAVSLWGLDEMQDEARRPRGNINTFPFVVKAIKRLIDARVPFNVSTVVGPENAAFFPKLLEYFWDTESPNFFGRDLSLEQQKPVTLGIGFFRPQTTEQLQALQNGGYTKMVAGLRTGFAAIKSMIDRGIPIPPLTKWDYLNLSGVIAAPCGSGFNYVAVGPDGATSCHENLFTMESNLARVGAGENLFDLVNERYVGEQHFLLGTNIEFPDAKSQLLALHGGAGCPHTQRAEHDGQLGHAASTAQELYGPILEELLSLEAIRQLRLLELGLTL